MKFFFPLVTGILLLFYAPVAAQPGTEPPAEQQPSTDEQLAGQFYQNGEWEKAAGLYEKLYDKSPVNFYYSQLVNCYLNLKDSRAAEKLVNKQIRRNPRQLSYLVDLGYVYRESGEEDKAKKQFEKALKELDPGDDRQVMDLAVAFEQRRQSELAIRTYLTARKAVPRAYNFNIQLATLYARRGETANMLAEYVELVNRQGYAYMEQIQQSLQDIIAADATGEKSNMVKDLLVKEIQRNPDNIVFSDLLIWFFVQKKEFEAAFTQTRALDKRLRENGQRVMELARTAVSNDQFETGKKAYQYVIDKGPGELYMQARKELSVALYRRLTTAVSYTPEELNELELLLQQTYSELGPGEQSYAVAIRLAHLLAFYRNQPEKAIELLEPLAKAGSGLSLRPLNEVKLEMADIQLLQGEIWEATLTYSQVEKAMKTDTLGQEAKFRNAKLAYYKGEFDWAKAQLDVLKAATSKLIANDALELSLLIGDNTVYDTTGDALRMFARADLWFYQNKINEALVTLDSLEAEFPESTLADELLYRKAKIAIRQGRYTDAAATLDKILALHRTDILADNALFMLAELHERQLNKPEKAMELYKELLTDFPGSLFVVEARKRFRILRGDTVQ